MLIQFLKKMLGIGNTIDFAGLITDGAQIIDVRTPQEFQNGHLKNSINLPLQNLAQQLSRLNKNKSVILVCASGMRSASAKSILLTNGFEEVYNGGSWANLKKHDVE